MPSAVRAALPFFLAPTSLSAAAPRATSAGRNTIGAPGAKG